MELLRDRSAEFEEANVRAVGVSRDSPWSHVAWTQALDLNFTLLSDWNAEAVRGFGIAHEFRGFEHVAGLAAMWPATKHFGTHFAARAEAIEGEASVGDHLQAVYHLWLVGHQLEHGRSPWLDPYTFRPESSPRVNFGGWPFGLPYWPLWGAFGPVTGWNVLLLLTYLAAGGFVFLWLRELRLHAGAALCGGLAFELAPYRVAQSAGHLRGMIAVLLPLALWAFERSRRGSRWWLALAVGAALLVRKLAISGSFASGGRSLQEVAFYSADGLDFVTRHRRHGQESFVFVGWLTPLLALAGLALVLRT